MRSIAKRIDGVLKKTFNHQRLSTPRQSAAKPAAANLDKIRNLGLKFMRGLYATNIPNLPCGLQRDTKKETNVGELHDSPFHAAFGATRTRASVCSVAKN